MLCSVAVVKVWLSLKDKPCLKRVRRPFCVDVSCFGYCQWGLVSPLWVCEDSLHVELFLQCGHAWHDHRQTSAMVCAHCDNGPITALHPSYLKWQRSAFYNVAIIPPTCVNLNGTSNGSPINFKHLCNDGLPFRTLFFNVLCSIAYVGTWRRWKPWRRCARHELIRWHVVRHRFPLVWTSCTALWLYGVSGEQKVLEAWTCVTWK